MKHIKTIKIPATKGTKVIADSKLFSNIDSDFKNWKTDEKGKPTKAMNLDIFEMDKDATFEQMISPENLLTQEQILCFVKNHKDLLRKEGYSTFFPFKSNGEIFVASVYFNGVGRLSVFVFRLSYGLVLFAVRRHRVVVPKLALKPLENRPSDTLNLESLEKRITELEKWRKDIKNVS